MSLDIAETKFREHNVRPAHRNTLDWLFDPEIVSFSRWLRSHDPAENRPYWIQGKPGSGKSTLMKYAISQLKTMEFLCDGQSERWTISAFFFHGRGETVQKSLGGMMQELLHSMLKQNEALLDFTVPHWRRLKQEQKKDSVEWSLENLISALTALLSQDRVSARFCLFLDALDEHGGKNEQLIEIIRDLLAAANKSRNIRLKICLASRPWPVFLQQFSASPSLEIHKLTEGDIKNYVMDRLREASVGTHLLLDTGTLPAMAEQVVSKALGVFIWVRLAVDALAKGIRDGTSSWALNEIVQNLPQELEDLYRYTLERIDPEYSSEALIMLQTTLCALTPLSVDTLMNIVDCNLHSVKPGVVELKNPPNRPPSSQRRRLVSRSGGLLEVAIASKAKSPSYQDIKSALIEREEDSERAAEEGVEEVVQFIHQTAKDFVQRFSPDLGLPVDTDQKLHWIRQRSGHEFLLKVCSLQNGWARPIKSCMFEHAKLAETNIYANMAATLSNEDDLRVLEILAVVDISFELSSLEMFLDKMQCDYMKRVEEYLSAVKAPVENCLKLCLLIAANLVLCVASVDMDVAEMTKASSNLLTVAVSGPDLVDEDLCVLDRQRMIETLHSRGFDPNNYDPNNFIQFRTEIDFSNRVAWFPLASLCEPSGFNDRNEATRLELAKKLLELGSGTDSTIFAGPNLGYGRIPLLEYCVRYGDAAFVRLLLAHGAKPDNIVQIWAWRRKDLKVIAALREHGVNMNPSRTRPEHLYQVHNRISDVGGMIAACAMGHFVPAISEDFKWI